MIHFHTWSRWVTYWQGIKSSRDDRFLGNETRQYRECLVCGKRKERFVTCGSQPLEKVTGVSGEVP